MTLKDNEVLRYKKKGVNDVFAMILAAFPTTKQALLASFSGVGNNNF